MIHKISEMEAVPFGQYAHSPQAKTLRIESMTSEDSTFSVAFKKQPESYPTLSHATLLSGAELFSLKLESRK